MNQQQQLLLQSNPSPILSLQFHRKLDDRLDFRGLKISVENKAGSTRKGVGKDGQPWSVTMTHAYGYLTNGISGVDGDKLDCFVGKDETAENVYVIHTTEPTTGKYDEDKCMLGFPSPSAAKKCFLQNYSSPKFFGSMTTISFDKFKEKVMNKKFAGKKMAAGGVGSGCHGDRCGRKAMSAYKDAFELHDSIRYLELKRGDHQRVYKLREGKVRTLMTLLRPYENKIPQRDRDFYSQARREYSLCKRQAELGKWQEAYNSQEATLSNCHAILTVLTGKDSAKDIKAAALTIGTQVTVDGLPGRGLVNKTSGNRVEIRFRNGMTISRHARYVHPFQENTQNKTWRDDNRHELHMAKEWTDLQEGNATDIKPVNGSRIEKQGTQFCVKKDGVDKNFGCFPSKAEAEARQTMRVKDLIVAGGPGSGCKGDNCGRPKKEDRTDPRQTSLHGPKHSEELRDWYARRQKQVDEFEKALNRASGKMMAEYRNKITHHNTYHSEHVVFRTHYNIGLRFLNQGTKLLLSAAAQEHLAKAKESFEIADNNAVKDIRKAAGDLNWAFHQMRLAVQAGPIAEEHKKIMSEDPRQLRLFNNGETIKADSAGEPMAGNMAHSHIEPKVWFHPPSLKNPDHVPTDDPQETDDKFGDVTKRKSKATQEFRMKQLKKQGPPSLIPARSTYVPNHEGVFNPNVFGSAKVIQRPAKMIGAKRTSVSYARRGCI